MESSRKLDIAIYFYKVNIFPLHPNRETNVIPRNSLKMPKRPPGSISVNSVESLLSAFQVSMCHKCRAKYMYQVWCSSSQDRVTNYSMRWSHLDFYSFYFNYKTNKNIACAYSESQLQFGTCYSCRLN
jgi:hypothetical protein